MVEPCQDINRTQKCATVKKAPAMIACANQDAFGSAFRRKTFDMRHLKPQNNLFRKEVKKDLNPQSSLVFFETPDCIYDRDFV